MGKGMGAAIMWLRRCPRAVQPSRGSVPGVTQLRKNVTLMTERTGCGGSLGMEGAPLWVPSVHGSLHGITSYTISKRINSNMLRPS